jgi:hypothetical protein
MKIVKHLKSGRYYIRLLKLTNGTNEQDGQIMWLYFGKYKNKYKLGFFVRECIEFNKKFK